MRSCGQLGALRGVPIRSWPLQRASTVYSPSTGSCSWNARFLAARSHLQHASHGQNATARERLAEAAGRTLGRMASGDPHCVTLLVMGPSRSANDCNKRIDADECMYEDRAPARLSAQSVSLRSSYLWGTG